MALVVILSRAGLGMDPGAFRKLYGAILKLGIVPWAVEWIVVTLLGHYWLEMPWLWSLMLGKRHRNKMIHSVAFFITKVYFQVVL